MGHHQDAIIFDAIKFWQSESSSILICKKETIRQCSRAQDCLHCIISDEGL